MANPIAGFNAKVRINGQIFDCQEFSIDDEVTEGDVTTFEGEGFSDAIGCIEKATVTLKQASYDTENNPYGTPQVLIPRTEVVLEIYPQGLAASPWQFPSFLILKLSHNGNANQLQPVDLSGRTRGRFFRPDET